MGRRRRLWRKARNKGWTKDRVEIRWIYEGTGEIPFTPGHRD